MLVFLSVLMLAFGSVLLTACGETETAEYFILLMDEDEITQLYGEYVAAGAKISDVPTPTKDSDAQYTYTFAGWVDEDGNKYVPTVATKSVTAYATYTATAREYSLTVTSNGAEVYSYEKVKILREDSYLTTGSVLHYGDQLSIEVVGSNGYSHDEGDISYQGLEMVEGENGTYFVVRGDVKISYTEEQETYTVTFYDVDGTKLYSTSATYGSSVTYPDADPTRATDLRASYVFDNWVDASGNYVNLNKITGDTKVYAQYNETLVPYYLTIESGARVYVYKNGTQITTGTTIYYGDELQIVANPTEGHYVSALNVNSSAISLTNNSTTVIADENGVSITGYEETIYTFSVVLYNGDDEILNTTVEYGGSVNASTPNKTSTLRATYDFDSWIDSTGATVSLSSIKSDIVGYASYTEVLIKYHFTLSNNVTVTLDDGTIVTTSNASTTPIYYGDTFTAEYTVADGYTFNKFEVGTATEVSGVYTIGGNVTITFEMSKIFIADKYLDMQQFTGFADSTGKVVYASSLCTQEESFMLYTYVGDSEVDLTAAYADFLDATALNFTATYYDGSNYQTKALSHTATYNSNTNTLTGSGNWNYTDYFTTPVVKGMELEFTLTITETILFGLATSDQIENPANSVWSYSSASSGYGQIFIPIYNVYSYSGETYLKILSSKLYSDDAKTTPNTSTGGTTSIMTIDNAKTSPFYTSDTYTYGEVVSVKMVLGDYLEIYITNTETDETIQLGTKAWTIDESEEYYFTFLSGDTACTVQITDFGYPDTIESLYLETLAGEEITLLGDSITAGDGTTWGTGESADTSKYSTLLAASLGMSETNMGKSGTVYCTGGERTSRINDVSNISTSSKIVTILLGTNDFALASEEWATLGEIGSTDTTTIYGALEVMYSALADRFDEIDAKIYICTTIATKSDISSASSNGGVSTLTCGAGYTLAELGEAEKKVAAKYGFSVIDLYNDMDWDISWFDGTKTSSGGFGNEVHPSPDGHVAMAEYLYNYILADNMYGYVLGLLGY